MKKGRGPVCKGPACLGPSWPRGVGAVSGLELAEGPSLCDSRGEKR